MRVRRIGTAGRIASAIVLASMIFAASTAVHAREFERYLGFVDKAIRSNPNHAPPEAVDACLSRRNWAAHLGYSGYEIQAVRALRYCFSLLGLSEADVEKPPDPELIARRRAAAERALHATADEEDAAAEALVPDIAHGLEIYRECAACHTPEGHGMPSGMVPQISGQHRSVIIKQLADIRAGWRKNQIMAPYASIEAIGGPQSLADVAAYIESLEISVENGKGPGDDLELGRILYTENCVGCHGPSGEGDPDRRIPRIQSQHFGYLVYQFELIRDGGRRNADPEMVKQIKGFDEKQIEAVMDYVSRLEPIPERRAPAGWRNPDFMLPRGRLRSGLP